MKGKKRENYLERIPVRSKRVKWSVDEIGMVSLNIENTGVFNRIAQKLLKKPKISHIHLDEMGSFLWPLLEDRKSVV